MRPRKKDRHLPAKMYHRHGAYYYVHKGKWTRLGVNLHESLAAYARLVDQPAGGMDKLIDRVLEDAEARGVKPNTMAQYKIAAAKLKKAFAEFSPEQVEPKDVAEFMDLMSATPNMANRCRSVLKMAFDIAVRRGIRDSNPVISIERHREARRDRYLTDDEYQRLLANASPALAPIIQIAYLTAQRIGDVLAIRRDDVTDEGIFFRQQKTGARLLVAMTPELKTAIDAAKALHGVTAPMYLLGQRNGKIRSYRAVNDLFRRATERAGLTDVRLHDLRAKSLTDAKRQGLNAQQLAGHTTEAQTVRYIRNRETQVVHGPSIGHVKNNAR